ncbi:MAG: response regulator [Nitrososphaeraceae archaeon]
MKKRILLVDDEPDNSTLFRIALEDSGFEVHTYNNPIDALASFKPSFYDLLLVDINMPKMNGFELYKRILEIDLNVKICFITAEDTNIDGLREVYPSLSTGCFIKKPISISDLVKRLKTEIE